MQREYILKRLYGGHIASWRLNGGRIHMVSINDDNENDVAIPIHKWRAYTFGINRRGK